MDNLECEHEEDEEGEQLYEEDVNMSKEDGY